MTTRLEWFSSGGRFIISAAMLHTPLGEYRVLEVRRNDAAPDGERYELHAEGRHPVPRGLVSAHATPTQARFAGDLLAREKWGTAG